MDGVVEKITVPDIGDFDEVDVVEVLVTGGDTVAVEDPLITLESDKATMDVPSPLAGKVVDVKVRAGDKVATGALILTLSVTAEAQEQQADDDALKRPASVPAGGDASLRPADDDTLKRPVPAPAETEEPLKRPASAPAETEEPLKRPASAPAANIGPAPIDEFPTTGVYASPSVRRFARQLGVDLSRVKGTGRKGRILKEDVQGFVKKVMAEPAGVGSTALPPMPVIDFSKFGPVDIEPLSRIQQLSLTNLHRSWLHVPHVTQHDKADITDLEAFRQANSPEAKAQGFSLTPVAFVMKASVTALKEFPRVNSSLDPDAEHVILKQYYHLGVAVDTPGGLVVPVIRDVDKKGILEIAAELAEVSERARQGKLGLDEIRGASFTITSLGGIGGTAFTPIVNAPEVAILGVSRMERQPVWNGEKFEPRLMLPLSFSYDHRVIDGAMAVRFTTFLCQVLTDIRRLLL
jgi:pyruvate dehydrogenase E2 component (dihydrolipoamide acetyltransferase)